eukprot:422292-Rhodomonas_salina.2
MAVTNLVKDQVAVARRFAPPRSTAFPVLFVLRWPALLRGRLARIDLARASLVQENDHAARIARFAIDAVAAANETPVGVPVSVSASVSLSVCCLSLSSFSLSLRPSPSLPPSFPPSFPPSLHVRSRACRSRARAVRRSTRTMRPWAPSRSGTALSLRS